MLDFYVKGETVELLSGESCRCKIPGAFVFLHWTWCHTLCFGRFELLFSVIM